MKVYKIIWSEFASKLLDDIFGYYKTRVSHSVSREIVLSIITDIEKLERNPLIGQKEEILKNRELEYRNLVSTNYKIIYSIDELNQMVKITDIFDTRQNPKNIFRNK